MWPGSGHPPHCMLHEISVVLIMAASGNPACPAVHHSDICLSAWVLCCCCWCQGVNNPYGRSLAIDTRVVLAFVRMSPVALPFKGFGWPTNNALFPGYDVTSLRVLVVVTGWLNLQGDRVRGVGTISLHAGMRWLTEGLEVVLVLNQCCYNSL